MSPDLNKKSRTVSYGNQFLQGGATGSSTEVGWGGMGTRREPAEGFGWGETRSLASGTKLMKMLPLGGAYCTTCHSCPSLGPHP